MADNILRLKVDSQEYDAKIKRAAEGIRRYADECRKAGGTLEIVEKETLDFVRSIGQMETVCKNATGKLNEMKQAYVELSMQYKQMTDAEKQSPLGKAMSESLDQLKVRINETKRQLSETNKEIGETSKIGETANMSLKDLAGSFGLNVSKMTSFGIVIAATKGAFSVFSDVLNSNREAIDTWGREIDSAKSLYDGFLNAINSGDISGYLSNIDQIISAARQAYNAMSELKEFNAFNKINIQNARTGLNETITEFRNGNASKDQVRQANEILKNELRERGKREQAVYEETISKVAKEYKTSAEDLKKLLSGNYVDWENAKHSYLQGSGQSFTFSPMASPYVWTGKGAQIEAKNTPRTSEEHLSVLARTIPVERLDELQQLGQTAAATETEIAQLDKSLSRLLNKKDPKQTTPTTTTNPKPVEGSIDAQSLKVQELQKAWRAAADDDSRTKIKVQLDEAQKVLDTMSGKEIKIEAPTGSLKALGEELKKLQDERQLLTDPIAIEIQDQAIKDVQDEIDRLNGKKVTIDVEANMPQLTAGEALEQEVRIKLAEHNMDADMQTLRTLLETQIKNGIEDIEIPSDLLIQQIMGEGLNIPDKYWEDLQKQINEKLKEMGIDQIDIDFNTGKSKDKKKDKERDTLKDSRQLVGGLNAVASGLQQMGIELPKEVNEVMGFVNGLMNVIEGLNSIISIGQIGAITANTVALGALTAAISTNTAVSLIPFFSNGGIVPKAAGGRLIGGNNMSGDNIFAGGAWVNSGELVLNKAEQGNLASQLQDNEMQSAGGGIPYVMGEQIILGANNHLKRSGQGEIVTTGMLKRMGVM